MTNPENTRSAVIRAESLDAVLADVPKADDHDGVRAFLHALAARGCAPLLVRPGTKQPTDMRTVRTRNADDRAAQQSARDAGRRNWTKVTSPSGLALATTDTAILDGYLDQYVRTYGDNCSVNLAVEVGGSRLVVVDCDTSGQMAAFLADVGAPDGTPPTVRSPGAFDAKTDEWKHRDGGHFYFTVPDGVELPESPGTMTDPVGGYAVLWNRRYVLTPPSVRDEGPYTVTGHVHELPEWLRDRIIEHGRTRAAHVPKFPRDGNESSPIEAWGMTITWAEILSRVPGWVRTGSTDTCGCDVWTAPGEHASAKSATAHEWGCSHPRWTDSVDPPMHLWTDHPGEPFAEYVAEKSTQTVSRLHAVALIDFDDDMGAAMAALDLHDDLSFDGGSGATSERVSVSDNENLPDEFWAAHPVLTQIRQAAHRGVNSADAVFGSILARQAAHLDPSVTVDTGVKTPMPLNMFVGLVGSAGTGKSSAFLAADRMAVFDQDHIDPSDVTLVAAREVPPELPVGSGPGVAEAFMGYVVDPLSPKVKVRQQVRHKLLLHSDEGAGLVSCILDNKRGQDIGPTLRAAWTGAVLGQANASTERRREVREYSVGLCVGFQLEALAALSTSEQLEYGTPQRFLYVSATDPAIPDDAPDGPGQLTVRLPTVPLRYSDELAVRARREALERARGGSDDPETHDPMNAHRPALVARLAAHLVILCDPDRSVIEASDVALAEMVLTTSARLHDKAMVWRREREAADRERQTNARINEHVATAVAVDSRDATLTRLKDRIIRYVDEADGRAPWKGREGLRKAKFKSDERALADVALARLTEGTPARLVVDGDEVARP